MDKIKQRKIFNLDLEADHGTEEEVATAEVVTEATEVEVTEEGQDGRGRGRGGYRGPGYFHGRCFKCNIWGHTKLNCDWMKRNVPDIITDYEKREVSANVLAQDSSKKIPKEEKLSSTIEQLLKQEESDTESTS